MEIRTVDREDLKAKLDRGDDFRLVMALNDFAFRAKRIPSSVYYPTVEAAFADLAVDDEIIVYCSDPACVASQFAYRGLVANGYRNVRRYAGGLSGWEDAGYPLEGDAVDDG